MLQTQTTKRGSLDITSLGSIVRGIMTKLNYSRTPELEEIIGVSAKELQEATQIAQDPTGYKRFYIKKRYDAKELRPIDAPRDELKMVQRAIYGNLLAKQYKPSTICHSYVPRQQLTCEETGGTRWLWGRSIFSGAWAHLGVPADAEPNPENPSIIWRYPKQLFSIDIRKAFPSIKDDQVYSIYQEFVPDPRKASQLTVVSTLRGALPQGAPTSPILFNLRCRELDRDLIKEFPTDGYFTVTRYVDDLVMTSACEITKNVRKKFIDIVQAHNFKINMDKLCRWRDYQHILRVTGINLKPAAKKLGLTPATRNHFRYVLYRSLQVTRDANADWLKMIGEEKNQLPFVKFVESARDEVKSAFGKIFGVASCAYMAYGDNAPPRLYNWAGRQGTENSFEGLLNAVKNGRLIASPARTIWDIYNQDF